MESRNTTTTISSQQKLCVSIPEMAKLLGISRSAAYTLSHAEGFPIVRFGEKRKVIPVKQLEAWLEAKASGR